MPWTIFAAFTVVVVLFTMVLPAYLARRQASRFTVTADALLRDSEELFRWDDLIEVAFVTTDGGPETEDLFLVLSTANKPPLALPCLAIPHAVLARIWDLPNFDRDAFGRAMASTHREKHVLWKRAA